MNVYSIIGFFMAVCVLAAGILLSTPKVHIFFDLHAFLLVGGGTLAATAISFQLDRLLGLFRVFFLRVVKGKRIKFSDIVKNIMLISEGYRKGESLEELQKKANDYFLREAIGLMADEVLSEKELFEVLEERAEHMHFHYMEDATKIKGTGKFPPAFGLMGTSIGMIVILSSLEGSDALKSVGPAMSIALTATLYGIVLANFVLIPIGENLTDAAKEVHQKNILIIEGMKLIKEKANPIIVAEKLNSFLLPGDRLDWKALTAK